MLIATYVTFKSVFKDKKLLRSHKTVEINVFLDFFAFLGSSRIRIREAQKLTDLEHCYFANFSELLSSSLSITTVLYYRCILIICFCRDADDAVYEMHGKDLLGARVTVEHAKVRCKNLLSAPFFGGGGAFCFALSSFIFVIFCGCIEWGGGGGVHYMPIFF